MLTFRTGRYRARFAKTQQDVIAAQTLRSKVFLGRGDGEHGRDADVFDGLCDHILIEDIREDRLVCCFRMLELSDGSEITRSYSAQYYELSALSAFTGPMVEMGRFCVDPDVSDPNILRVAWSAMTRFVDERGVEILFGCSSFSGTEAEIYMDAFALLKERHLAPKRWLPKVKAPNVFRFAERLGVANRKRAMLRMPPLLKTYLVMGGWVSDHAVVDQNLNTLHVFTALEIGAIPAARARALRAMAG